jgi:hypothetical protein
VLFTADWSMSERFSTPSWLTVAVEPPAPAVWSMSETLLSRPPNGPGLAMLPPCVTLALAFVAWSIVDRLSALLCETIALAALPVWLTVESLPAPPWPTVAPLPVPVWVMVEVLSCAKAGVAKEPRPRPRREEASS